MSRIEALVTISINKTIIVIIIFNTLFGPLLQKFGLRQSSIILHHRHDLLLGGPLSQNVGLQNVVANMSQSSSKVSSYVIIIIGIPLRSSLLQKFGSRHVVASQSPEVRPQSPAAVTAPMNTEKYFCHIFFLYFFKSQNAPTAPHTAVTAPMNIYRAVFL